MVILEEITKFFVQSANAILILPLWVILMIWLNSVMAFVSSKKLTFNLSVLMSFAGIIFSLCGFYFCIHNPQTVIEWNVLWFQLQDAGVSIGTLVDNISVSLMFFINCIFLLLEIYSYGYFQSEKNFHKFFFLLNFLKFSLFGLVLSSNIVQAFIFWELSGAALYLLVNFWQGRKSVSDASKKMLIIDKIGSVAFLGGIVVLIYFFIIFPVPNNISLLLFGNIQYIVETLYSMVSNNTFFYITVLFAIPILVRMAQFPFQNRVDSFVEAPVPVSAILQGVIPLVCSGFLLMRLYSLFILSENIMKLFVAIGLISVVAFAYVAISQNNIKKMFAYLSVAQLGLLLIGFGLGGFSGAVLYLIQSGFATVLLIMSSGAIITAMNNEHDIKYFGELRKSLPVLSIAFIVGIAALLYSVTSLLYSKNIITSDILNSYFPFICTGVLVFLFLISFSLFRAYFLIFEGKKNWEFELYNVPKRLYFSTIVLIFTILFTNFILKDKLLNFIYFVSVDCFEYNIILSVIFITVILFALYIAFLLYGLNYSKFVIIKEKVLAKENLIYKISYNAFYLDNVADWVIDKILLRFCNFCNFVDKYLIRGLSGLIGFSSRFFSYLIFKSQNGALQTYILYTILFIALILVSIVAIFIIGSLMGV